MSISGTNGSTPYTGDNKTTTTTPGTDKNKKTNSSNGIYDYTNMRKPTSELGQDAFMKILIAQMANQDPMEPMKDTDFIAQMAQFTALEQMNALNQSFTDSQAYNMVGKSVIATTYVLNETTSEYEKVTLRGVVSGVQTVQGRPYLVIGEYLVDPSSVSQVYQTPDFDNNVIQGGNLVGKYVTASVSTPEEGDRDKVTKYEGIVSQVVFKEGRMYAKIGKDEILVSNITSVSETKPPDEPSHLPS